MGEGAGVCRVERLAFHPLYNLIVKVVPGIGAECAGRDKGINALNESIIFIARVTYLGMKICL